MARGYFQAYSRITTATDTAVIAAPGANERINILWLTMDVQTSEASSVALAEDGAGGNIIATLDCSDDNNRIERVYHHDKDTPGYQLTENTAFNIDTNTGGFSGTAALIVNVGYEVT